MKRLQKKNILIPVVMFAVLIIGGCGGGGGSISGASSTAGRSGAALVPPLVAQVLADNESKKVSVLNEDTLYQEIKNELNQINKDEFVGDGDQRTEALNAFDITAQCHKDKDKDVEKELRRLREDVEGRLKECTKHKVRCGECSGGLLRLRGRIDTLIGMTDHRGIKSLEVSAEKSVILVGETVALTAKLTFKDGRSADVTEKVDWVLSNAAPGYVQDSIYYGVAAGNTLITADLLGVVTSEPVAISVNEPAPPAPPAPPADPVTPVTPVTPVDNTPFTCGSVVSLTAPTGWGVYPDSLVAFEAVPGDGVNWGIPLAYIYYDYSGNYAFAKLTNAQSPTGCLISEGNPDSELTEAVLTMVTDAATIKIYFPDLTTRAANSNMAVYVGSDGATYWARSDNYEQSSSVSAPNLTYEQAVSPEHLARQASTTVASN
jgi:hypothetical protein